MGLINANLLYLLLNMTRTLAVLSKEIHDLHVNMTNSTLDFRISRFPTGVNNTTS